MSLIWIALIFVATLFVAYSNGANDNFKGVATLFGSGTTNYRKALIWANATTLAGSCAAFFLAEKLIKTFSGKGLVPDTFIGEPAFVCAVILGAAVTVFAAARMGIPISTTHGLTGALVGAGFMAVGSQIHFSALQKSFFIPLMISPLIAFVAAVFIYPALRTIRKWTGIHKDTCICIGGRTISVKGSGIASGCCLSAAQLLQYEIVVDEKVACEARAVDIYRGQIGGIDAQSILDAVHFLSAGAVGFARGLNDTPKIVALSAGFGILGLKWNIAWVALAMLAGGILSARKVALTMSKKITSMNHGQGFTANFITAFLVIFASGWGVPVSTTHVSCGTLFGIGLVNKRADWKIIRGILGAWFLTLPVAAISAGLIYVVLKYVGEFL